MSDKIYVGRVETKEGKYGELISVSLGPQDFEKLEAAKNQRGWVNLNWKQSKDGGYYMEVYQNASSAGGSKVNETKQAFTQSQSNDLPF
jgi:predicted dithiol-disulfide oxidoreductase (DUF899 family)